ncbi:MAG: CoA transferase [Acidimicrobiia bacterium]|nr:CoA transferase [Acidimicrobiia bacterium]
MTKTKAELFEATFSRRVLIAPVTTTAELVHSGHLADRGFWEDVDAEGQPGRGGSGPVRFPGAFAKFSATPLPPQPMPAALGAHTLEVRAEPPRAVARPDGPPPVGGLPLAGLKVADFMWVFAGPWASRALADLGATVVRVESMHHLDTLRTAGNFQDDRTDPEWALQFGNMNAGKLGLALDLSKPEARDVARDLVRWADVALESFTPKAMRGLGLDYESLRKVKPDLVMASSCLMGQTGRHSALAGFGTMAAAVSGFFHVTGWPDRAPCGPFGAYTDYVSPRFLLASVLAALEWRRRTGQGQYIDLSQAEASMRLLAPAVLDYTVNGRVVERQGNDDVSFAPHGVYPAFGEDQWVAIAVASDEQWRALCEVLPRADLAGLSGLSGAARRARRRELDELLCAWTRGCPAGEVMELLQRAGVPAHQVQNTVEAFADPQLRHRGHFVQVPQSAMGQTWVEGSRLRLSRTPARVERGAPTIGEHSWQVLTEVLGYDEDRAAELAVAGVFE